MAQYDVDLREYWRVVKKRKWVIIIITFLVAFFAVLFSWIKQPTPLYRAVASIKIEQKANLAILLTGGGYWGEPESMATHAYTITSFPVLKKTAEKLGWLPKGLDDTRIYKNKVYLSRIDHLKEMIKTDYKQGTSIIDIIVTSRNPKECERIANTVAKAYKEYNIERSSNRIKETRDFIEKQLAETLARMKEAEAKLRKYKEKSGLVNIEERTKELMGRLSAARAELEKVRQDKSDVEKQLSFFSETSMKGLPEVPAKRLIVADPQSPLYEFRSKLQSLLLERQRLLSKYTEKHPEVQAVENQIKMMALGTKSDLELLAKTLSEKEAALTRRISQLEKYIRNLPAKTQELVRLERELELQDELYTDLKKKHQEVLIQESGKIENVALVRPAIEPTRPFNIPSGAMILFSGLILGLILGVVFAFGIEIFDTSMGTIEDVEESLAVPVVGVIPSLDGEERKKKKEVDKNGGHELIRARSLIAHYDPRSLASEAFRSLRTNLQFVRFDKHQKSFVITSAFIQEGKTLNSVNLALSLAQAGEKVLLIDADLRRSMIHRIFGLNRTPGLTDYILGNFSWEEVVNTISDIMLGDFEIDEILETPGLDNLHIICAGTKPPNPTEILNSQRFRDLLADAYGKYSYILVDVPPVLPVADALEVAPHVDGVILVYMVGRIARGVLRRAKTSLDNVDAKVSGVILNNVKPEVGPDYFKYHTKYYTGDTRSGTQVSGGKSAHNILELVGWEQIKEKKAGLLLFIVALVFLILGIFFTF